MEIANLSTMMNTVIILIGPKGSGKTYIGTLLERTSGGSIHFVRVEAIFMKLQQEQKDANMATLAELCYQETAKEVNDVLSTAGTTKAAILEVTGVAPQLPSLVETLKSDHMVKFVKVTAPENTCLERVQQRDASTQVDVALDRVAEINRLASAVEFPWDLQLDNGSFKSDQDILDTFSDMLGK